MISPSLICKPWLNLICSKSYWLFLPALPKKFTHYSFFILTEPICFFCFRCWYPDHWSWIHWKFYKTINSQSMQNITFNCKFIFIRFISLRHVHRPSIANHLMSSSLCHACEHPIIIKSCLYFQNYTCKK